MFYPHEITDKERATAQMIAASHQMALKALVDLKEWENVHTAHTPNRDIVWAARQNMRRAGFKFQKVMVVEGFMLYF
jgi:hypothetical protein